MDIIARRPRPSVQEVLAGDVNPAPLVLRSESPATGQSDADIPIDRYFSREWHEREVEKIWRKTWQLACRVEDIPEPGDQINYDIVHDSLLIVRTGDGGIKAYINACLHRGTMLRVDAGNAPRITCPFHGWSWTLEGELRVIPGKWDFPQVDKAKMCLPEVQVGTWGGFVFVNMDPDCEPLDSYLETSPSISTVSRSSIATRRRTSPRSCRATGSWRWKRSSRPITCHRRIRRCSVTMATATRNMTCGTGFGMSAG